MTHNPMHNPPKMAELQEMERMQRIKENAGETQPPPEKEESQSKVPLIQQYLKRHDISSPEREMILMKALGVLEALEEAIDDTNKKGDLAIWSDSVSYFDEQLEKLRDVIERDTNG